MSSQKQQQNRPQQQYEQQNKGPSSPSRPLEQEQTRPQKQFKQQNGQKENNKPQQQQLIKAYPRTKSHYNSESKPSVYEDDNWAGLMQKLSTIPYQPSLAERIRKQLSTDEDYSEVSVQNKYNKRIPFKTTEYVILKSFTIYE